MRYFNDSGLEVPAVTAEQIRELGRIATEETGPNLYQMMENAGRDFALLALDELGDHWRRASVVVLAGSGGNGGMGMCAARHLANRGVSVRVCLAEPTGLSEAAALQRKILSFAGGREIELGQLSETQPDLILDALIGYGLRSAPRGRVAELIRWANQAGAPILSLDVPSGIDPTTGGAPGVCVHPRATLTLTLPKTGLSRENCGELFLADVGIPEEAFRRLGVKYTSPFGAIFFIRLLPRAE